MVLDALVTQLVQRFRHEKRARVCLWFDERREFVRLLPTLRGHLAAMANAPFRLLEYDEEQCRGQIWLKYEIWRALGAACPAEQKRLRFVVYVPLSEDRLESAGADGDARLDLLVGVPPRRHFVARQWKAPEALQLPSAGRGLATRKSLRAALAVRGPVRTLCSRSTWRRISIAPPSSGTPPLHLRWPGRAS